MSAALSPAVRKALVIALAGCSVLGVPAVATAAKEESALSDEPLPLQVDKAPERPQPIELGPPFLGTGVIGSCTHHDDPTRPG